MLEHELLLLGLLKEKPRHGYEIKRKIKSILSLFAGVDLKSIYYPLNILEQRGLVVKHAGKQGRRPERFVYALTKKGEIRFSELLQKSFLNFKRPQFSLDLSLYFLKNIEPKIAKRRLKARKQILNGLAEELLQMTASLKKKKSTALSLISEHNFHMVKSEISFLDRLIKSL